MNELLLKDLLNNQNSLRQLIVQLRAEVGRLGVRVDELELQMQEVRGGLE